ncbi:MAG: hypothetical protein IPF75_14225 [Bacteroidetes bacterium]|nr:hypothetical protein [Bacteroidota bacterium]
MNKFKFGNMNDEKVYLDENNLRMTTNSYQFLSSCGRINRLQENVIQQ